MRQRGQRRTDLSLEPAHGLLGDSGQQRGPAKTPPATIGLRIMSELQPDGDAWRGRLFNREQGRTCDCRIAVRGDQLAVRGYVGLPVIGKTQIWRRMPA